MSEKGLRQNEPRHIENLENEKFNFDPRNPETWREGQVIDVGSVEEFNKYRKEVIARALKETINELVKREGLDRPGPQHLKLMDMGEHLIEPSIGLAGTARFNIVVSESLLDVVREAFTEDMWGRVMAKTGCEFSFDDFFELMVKKTTEISRLTQPAGITEYWKPHKDAYVLLTGNDRMTKKLDVGSFSTMENRKLKKTFKFISMRKEAFRILEKEERAGAKDLIKEVLEHEYQEIGHFINPAEAESPHKPERDKKFLEVLKVLRKRKYFH